MDKLSIFIRRAIRGLLTLLVLGVVVNDAVRFYDAFRTASEGSKAAMNAVVDAVRAQPDASAEPLAAQAAAAQGATLTTYAQQKANDSASLQVRVTLEASVPVTRTIIVGPVIGLIRDVPSDDWYSPDGVMFAMPNTKLVTEIGVAP
ncbi:MAG: hypothetical protein EG823_07750 [Actinobacteria bacterium]|nr:hypothetical protein [Actinomycetota bacterium]